MHRSNPAGRRVVAHLILTLDGVVNFNAVLASIMKQRNDEVLADFFRRVADEDAMLLGRVTYQEWVAYWLTSTIEPFASHINRVPKYVASRTLTEVSWGERANATLIHGGLGEAIATLKCQPGGNIGVHGSPTLVESMIRADLLDELRLELYPIVAGSGARLFRDGGPIKHLHLLESRTTGNGVVMLTYQPASN